MNRKSQELSLQTVVIIIILLLVLIVIIGFVGGQLTSMLENLGIFGQNVGDDLNNVDI